MNPAQPQSLTLRDDPAELPSLVAFIDAFFSALPSDPKTLNAFQLALEEVVLNVINHGYGGTGTNTLTVALACGETQVTATVADGAPYFDPLSRPAVATDAALEDRPIGGLGIHLVKKLMTRVDYAHRNGQNILSLTRALNPDNP